MKNIKYLFVALIVFSFYSCRNYKLVFVPTTSISSAKISKSFKYLEEEQLFLCFTKSYNHSKVKVFENDNKLIDTIIQTDSRNIALALKVNVNSKMIIYFEGIKKPLQITKEQMKNYKFIYIEKKRKTIIVEFNNGTKTLMDNSDYKLKLKDSIQ